MVRSALTPHQARAVLFGSNCLTLRMTPDSEILLVEDDESDVFLLKRAFKDVGFVCRLTLAIDGQDAVDILSKRQTANDDRLPALIILDLKMPRRNGMDVLEWLRKTPAFRCLTVFIFSSSEHRDDVEKAYTLGANAFLVKPPSVEERADFVRFVQQWLSIKRPS